MGAGRTALWSAVRQAPGRLHPTRMRAAKSVAVPGRLSATLAGPAALAAPGHQGVQRRARPQGLSPDALRDCWPGGASDTQRKAILPPQPFDRRHLIL
ncbi:hypothetical protein SEVIR_4G115802v4 [Setaria viridis]